MSADSRIVVYYDERCVAHDTGSGMMEGPPSPLLEVQERHPENGDRVRNSALPERLRLATARSQRATVRSVLLRGPLASSLEWRTPSRASVEELCCVHDRAYLESIVSDSEAGGRRYGASTVLPPGGWLGVSLAAGAALAAAELVLSGGAQRAFCLVRPPGHHASRAACDGFCFVNNAAGE